MMRTLTRLVIATMLCMLLISNSFAQKEQTFYKEFKAKANLDISLVSGDCIIEAGNSDVIKVDVKYTVRPKGSFKPIINESSNTLKLKEKWYHSSSSNVVWTITVPPKTKIDFSSASGDLSVEGLIESVEGHTASGDISILDSKGDFELKTASGDIEAENIQGELEFSTASGDIEAEDIKGEIDFSTASGEISVKNAEGEFDLSCASGDIDARQVIIKEASSFSTASGDVDVELAATPANDCDLSAASGDVALDFNGNKIQGYVELTAKKRRGKIRSDMAFDEEEEYERGDNTYMKKSFTKGGDSPEIIMSTSSGTVSLKK